MDSSQFSKLTSLQARALEYYFDKPGPLMVVRETLRFIQSNFEQQGWHGETFIPWRPNKKGLIPILHRSGDLQGGFNYSFQGDGAVLFYNNIPYAAVHNQGFNRQVKVPAHIRGKWAKQTVYNVKSHRPVAIKARVGEKRVEAYTRHANIVRRQFAPTTDSPSPVLEGAIVREMERDIKAIFKI